MKPIVAVILLILLTFQALAQETDLGRADRLLIDADQRFQAAIAERAAGSPSAADGFRAAARSYEAIADLGFHNPDLYVDAGNAYLLGGDIGRAVLSFRRADLLRPHDPAVRAGLADARDQVQVVVSKSRRARFIDVLLAWRPHVPRPVVLVACLSLYGLAWVLGIARAVSSGRVPGWAGAGSALVSGVLMLALVVDHRVNDGTSSGVVIAEGITARNGPSSAVYQPTFTTPLRPGVELSILEHRDAWYHVRLADGRQTWLPEHAVEPVQTRSADVR